MCKEKQCCISQIGGQFGFIPETPLKLYKRQPNKLHHILNILQAQLLVKYNGCHNYLKCRIPVNTHLSIDKTS